MIFRTLLFFVVMYFLVKIISRLFLPSNQDRQRPSGARIFYRTFQQFAQQNRQQQNSKHSQQQQSDKNSQRFEEIEEAEYEDITEEEKSTSKSPE